MSYNRKYEYTIIPNESFRIIRNCSVCGGKSIFVNSDKFRINANGNRIDVWLIYQCEKCKHTYNLTIYERLNKDGLSLEQYKSFMENDKVLAKAYGTDKSLFIKNKAEIDWSNIEYHIFSNELQKPITDKQTIYRSGDKLHIYNPLGLKIRLDKIIAHTLSITRSKLKQLQETGVIEIISKGSTNTIAFTITKDLEDIEAI